MASSFGFAVINLVVLVFLVVFIPENALPASLDVSILSEVTRGGLASLVGSVIIDPVHYYIMAVLIRPSRLGLVVAQLESMPDSEGYRDSPMAFFTIHILKPLMGFLLMMVSVLTLHGLA